MHTVEDILAQAGQTALLPALTDKRFVSQGLSLIENWQQAPPEGIRQGWLGGLRWGPLNYLRADDSVYYPALMCVVLQELEQRMDMADIATSKRIRATLTAQFGLYRSVPGLDSYAFWQTRPAPRFFPFGSRLRT